MPNRPASTASAAKNCAVDIRVGKLLTPAATVRPCDSGCSAPSRSSPTTASHTPWGAGRSAFCWRSCCSKPPASCRSTDCATCCGTTTRPSRRAVPCTSTSPGSGPRCPSAAPTPPASSSSPTATGTCCGSTPTPSIATGLDLGRHRQLLPELARLCAEHPVRERLVELHMRALYRHGRTAEALDVYHQARTRLADALGLDPGPVLQQLHQAILRGDPLPPTQVSPSPPSMASRVAPAQLPADLATFAGRVEQLNQLDTLLSSSATAVVISAIAGTAGIGKTALAVHWAHRVRDRFPDGQLYANLRGFDPAGPPTPPGGVIRRFLDALGVPIQRIPTDPDTQIDLYRSMLADKRILIVLDNAR